MRISVIPGCLLVLCLLAEQSKAQTRSDVVVFDEDDALGVGYYDASVPVVGSPSVLTTADSPYGGKLPILSDHAFVGTNSGLLEWKSLSGGDWTVFVASPVFQIRDLTGYSNLVFFVNGPAAIPAASLPRIGLESSSNQKTPAIQVGTFLPQGMDSDPGSWQRVTVPLGAFQPYGLFSLTQFKAVFFAQSLADNVTRTVWLDDLRVTDGRLPLAPVEPVTRAGDRSVVLHWRRNTEANLLGYRVYRSASTNGPFSLITATPLPVSNFCDFEVTNGQHYSYAVRALNTSWEESPDSFIVSAQPQAFASDAAFLEYLQHTAFDFFWYEANPTNGLVRDRSRSNSFASIAGVGFGLTGVGIAIDHGWISREQGRQRVLTTLRTFANGPQGTNASGMIGYRGWFYHMLDLNTATRHGTSELSSIDTALFLAGALYAKQYFDSAAPDEAEIRSLADALFSRVDWQWMANGAASLTMGWKPESGFLTSRWIGYNEAMVLYLMGLGAATNPLPAAHWNSWTSGYAWRTNQGQAYVEFPPLFGHQYSHCWVDFRHMADGYMRSRGISYFENSRRATLAQRAYAIVNPGGHTGYGSNVWGFTACDGPGFGGYTGYSARGAPPAQNDDGTIAPTAVGGSLPFAPEVCLPALRQLYDQFRTRLWTAYGFRDAFNLAANWWDPEVLAIDQGALLLMAENYRSQSVWQRFMRGAEIQRGLRAAGFTNLTFVPLRIQRGAQADLIQLAWSAVVNRSYQVEYSADLNNWILSPAGFLTATGSTSGWSDTGPPVTEISPAKIAQRFYRTFQYGPP